MLLYNRRSPTSDHAQLSVVILAEYEPLEHATMHDRGKCMLSRACSPHRGASAPWVHSCLTPRRCRYP